ncbi:hypothetical protein N0V93_000355 [Gnomoniopsis smithogilvyi]|uniref:C2H2-type domain-containing protein n=1 Tax=Gnomoniopsis smithogilvyi TaxID=1191159 RepID=A0A9W9D055_9PEZI|nr:hypothetical protein N0V93_000355 [Gnomoniopsis smithogilvyi]
MSVAYEHRAFPIDSPYAPVGEHNDHDADDADDDHDMNKYINTEANVDDMADLAAATYEPRGPSPFHTTTADSPAALDDLVSPPPPNVDPTNVPLPTPTHTPATRSKPIAKPSRPVTKNEAGMFECRWSDCKEEVKVFPRKCEWSKHMDKHERPYVCTVRGCEKVQGFTYSGGLLRHEREVHGKHGGPKKAFRCPHENCKRSSGKGFSRMENLQEHLRRVHTGASATPPRVGGASDEACASEVASAAFAAMTTAASMSGASPAEENTTAGGLTGCKRKRSGELDEEEHGAIRVRMNVPAAVLEEENQGLRQELAEVKRLNLELRAQLEGIQAQVTAFQAAISQLAVAVPPSPVL